MDPDEVRRKNRGHADASRKRQREKVGDDEYKRARRAEMVEYRRRKKEEREAAEAEAELEAEAAASEESGQPVEGAAAPLDALASAAEAVHAYDGSAAATLDEARREAAEAVRREEAARREELMAELAALRAQVAAREAAAPAPPHPTPPPYPAAPEPPPPAPPPPPPNAAPAPPRLPAALPSALTEEQRARIEANKQEALRKRAVRERAAAGPPPPTPHAAAAPPPAAPPPATPAASNPAVAWGQIFRPVAGVRAAPAPSPVAAPTPPPPAPAPPTQMPTYTDGIVRVSDALGISSAEKLGAHDLQKLGELLDAPPNAAHVVCAVHRLALSPMTPEVSRTGIIEKVESALTKLEGADANLRDIPRRWREQVAAELERRKPRYGPTPPPKTDGCPACAGKHRAHTCVQSSATKSTSAKSNEREGGGLTTVPLPSQSTDVLNPAMRSFLGR